MSKNRIKERPALVIHVSDEIYFTVMRHNYSNNYVLITEDRYTGSVTSKIIDAEYLKLTLGRHYATVEAFFNKPFFTYRPKK